VSFKLAIFIAHLLPLTHMSKITRRRVCTMYYCMTIPLETCSCLQNKHSLALQADYRYCTTSDALPDVDLALREPRKYVAIYPTVFKPSCIVSRCANYFRLPVGVFACRWPLLCWLLHAEKSYDTMIFFPLYTCSDIYLQIHVACREF
jgi:hypothetical protein